MEPESDICIELPYASITFSKERYIHIHFRNHALTIRDNKRILTLVRKHSPWKICPYLISGDEFASHDKESKKFHAAYESSKHCSAMAFLPKNMAQKLVVNFFIRFYQPKVPVLLFSDKSDALEWFHNLNGTHLMTSGR